MLTRVALFLIFFNLSWSRAKPSSKESVSRAGGEAEEEHIQWATRGHNPQVPVCNPFRCLPPPPATPCHTYHNNGVATSYVRGLWKLALYTASSPGKGSICAGCVCKLIHLYAENSTFCCCGQCYNVINSGPAANHSSKGGKGEEGSKGVWPEDTS